MSREYPMRPILSVGAVVVDSFNDEVKVLLVKRGRPPGKGLWAVPGGVVELGERLRDAVVREVLEETGVRVRVGPLVHVHEVIERDPRGAVVYHYVILDYLASPLSREVRPGSDVEDARWLKIDELASVHMTRGTRALLARLLGHVINA